MLRCVTARHAKGQRHFRERPPPRLCQHILLYQHFMTSPLGRILVLDTQETSEELKKWELLARARSLGLTGLPPCSVTEQRPAEVARNACQSTGRPWSHALSCSQLAQMCVSACESVLVHFQFWLSGGTETWDAKRPLSPWAVLLMCPQSLSIQSHLRWLLPSISHSLPEVFTTTGPVIAKGSQFDN